MSRPISRIPLRLRMTMWYGVLLGATLTVFGVVLYAGLSWRLNSAFDEQLNTQGDIVLSSIRAGSDTLLIDFQSDELTEREFFLRLFDQAGVMRDEQGQGAGGVASDPGAIARALAGAPTYRSAAAGGDQVFRVVTVPVRSGDEGPVVGVLEVGVDREDLDETLRALGIVLLTLVPVATLIAVGGGYVLAGPVLLPITRMTRLARQIGERDLHERLSLDLPDDEVGRLAATFNDMLGRIELAFERQRRFTSDAAHELRTPMSLLRGQVDLALARPRTTEEYVDALRAVDLDLARLTNLTAALLSLARLDRPDPVPEVAAFDLADTIEALAGSYEIPLTANAITLRRDLAPTLVMADEDLVIQVLVNLLDNALAFTPAGGTIVLACRTDGDQATITIRDTGFGIGAEHLSRVFDRFYRPDAGRARGRGGAGLGLAISRAIVEAHGGDIGVTSVVGEGSTFTVTLPRWPGEG